MNQHIRSWLSPLRLNPANRASMVLWATIFLSLLYVPWAVFEWGGTATLETVATLLIIANLIIVITFCVRAARHPNLDQQTSRAWLVLTLAFTAYLLGNLLFAYYQFIEGFVPFPSLADYFFVCFYPLVMIGLLIVPAQGSPQTTRLTLILDAALIMLGGATFLWHIVLHPTIATLESVPWLEAFFILFYPLGDLLIFFGATIIVVRQQLDRNRRAMNLLLFGLLLTILADSGLLVLNLQGGFEPGDWPDMLYVLKLAVIALAAYIQHHDADLTTPRPSSLFSMEVLLPYITLGMAYCLLLWVSMPQWNTPLGNLIFATTLLSGLVVARQLSAAGDLRQAHTETATALQETRSARLEMETLNQQLQEQVNAQEALNQQLHHSLQTQEALARTITDLSVPLIPVRDDVLVVPLIGAVDTQRIEVLSQTILQHVAATRTQKVFLDMTGVVDIDTYTAQAILDITRALRMVGATTTLVGIRPEVAETLVTLGIDLERVRTAATLQSGIEGYLLHE